MRTTNSSLPNSQFEHFQNKDGIWVCGCLLCLRILGTAESEAQLTDLEESHECLEKKPATRVNHLEIPGYRF